MSPSESNNFAQSMWKKGWVTYAVPSTRSRGVVTLVRKCWKSCRLFDVDNQGRQFLAVQVGHVTIGNLYAAHDTDRETCTSEVFEFLHSLGPSRWCLTGDFNDPPSVSPLVLGLSASGYNLCSPADGTSSRWEVDADRIIDYGFSNCAFITPHMLLSDERWSDHRAGIMQLQTPEMHSPNQK